MHWRQIREHPSLQDLPFKIETDRWGHILMSPASNRHSLLQGELQALLRTLTPSGAAFPECSVSTAEGVKVADVAWASAAFLARHGDADPYPEAPEILIEVISPSNSTAEMAEKRALYFAGGALEVWLCDEAGGLRFFDANGALEHSALVPTFPAQVRLPFDVRRGS
ncbi:MAG: Uma2 family endonuclease [Chromatiaceae bacterium]|nr:MAG: Uma2 family endonuclease [Chromatiaceae bacterium]